LLPSSLRLELRMRLRWSSVARRWRIAGDDGIALGFLSRRRSVVLILISDASNVRTLIALNIPALVSCLAVLRCDLTRLVATLIRVHDEEKGWTVFLSQK
jgi:hypothetical protein